MRSRIRARLRGEEELDAQPGHALVSVIRIPGPRQIGPWWLILRRLGFALGLLLLVAGVVYVDREGYSEQLSFIDALYYSAVSLSTTGYGDIAPVTQSARLVNIIIITPIRIAFVILLVGTTLAVLTEKSKQTWQIQRWRKRVRNHTIVIGYGTKGRSAVDALLADGADPAAIVVIDEDRKVLNLAQSQGLVTVHGSGTQSDVLRIAGISRARAVVVAPNWDDTAVLITLSARELAPEAMIVAAVREAQNKHLLEQSGADSVVISSETAGRLLGLATVTPPVVEMMADLLSPDEGFSVAERTVGTHEVGTDPRDLADLVLGVVRADTLHRIDSPPAHRIEPGDRLLYIRHVKEEN